MTGFIARSAKIAGGALAILSAPAHGADRTDFGVRTVGSGPFVAADGTTRDTSAWTPVEAPRVSISAIAALGARWGRVTSTVRSREHNRRVGGVPNSWHLRGRAIDIARRPGVSHHQIAAAYRAAGYHLIESLDEGDHSHFAFGAPGRSRPAILSPSRPSEVTEWKVVSAPGALR